MTKYRTISNGLWDYLQYQIVVHHSFLWKKWTTLDWLYVPTDYYDDIYGRFDDSRNYVNSLKHNIEKFVAENPDIEPYLEKTNKEIERKDAIKRMKNLEMQKKEGTTKEL